MNALKPHQALAHVVSLYDDLLGAMQAEVQEQARRADKAEAALAATKAELDEMKAAAAARETTP